MTQTFSISELAREFDVTARTIRYYEAEGMLAPAEGMLTLGREAWATWVELDCPPEELDGLELDADWLDELDADWLDELEDVGFLRRMLRARKWYGADWWMVVISSLMVLGFMVLAAFPQWFAPHDPLEQVGPRLLAPGEEPQGEVLVVAADATVVGIADLPAGERVPFAVIENTPSSEAARDEAALLSENLDERIRLRIIRDWRCRPTTMQ